MTASEHPVRVRPAQPGDLNALIEFIAPFVASGRLLPRTAHEMEELIEHGFLAVMPPSPRATSESAPSTGSAPSEQVVGFAALEVYSPKLAEIRSLAVDGNYRGLGIGTALVKACVDHARLLDVFEVLAVTSSEEFFQRCGFDFTLPGEKKALFLQTRPEY